MPTSARHVTLRFDPDHDEDDVLRGQLSAVTQGGRELWVASDEMNSVERLTPAGEGTWGAHRTFDLAEHLRLPGGPDEEIDVEGLDIDDGYLWLVGSHGLKRRKADAAKNPEKQIARLAELRADGNRYLLARVPLIADEEGPRLVTRDEGDGTPRCAARLMGGDRGNVLTEALRFDPHLAPFLQIPSKDNGLDVEGLAVRGDRVFLGLRGPVLRGWAVVLELEIEESASGLLGLRPVGEDGAPYRKHFLDLRGLGLRDMCFHGDDLLLLAGPTMDLDGPAGVFRWRDAIGADASQLLGKDALEEVIEVPYGTGEHDAHDHPEGLCLFRETEGDAPALLVVYDSPDRRRTRGESGVVADVFPLD